MIRSLIFGALIRTCILVLADQETAPLASACPGISDNRVVCIRKYASVMPQPFLRIHAGALGVSPEDTFTQTEVDADSSFDLVSNATFIVFNPTLALPVLGAAPELSLMFELPPNTVREAPVYVPCLNSIIFSTFKRDVLPQSIIDLNVEPPVLRDYTPNPPVYGINGGRYHNGSVYWAATGGFPFRAENGSLLYQSPGIVRLNPITNETTVLVNNYYGAQFNSPDDVVVASNGDIYFTDPCE
jgi:hypothetical protein